MLGDRPGVGKSYACKQMEAFGHNVLFVCPTNDLCIDNVFNSGIFAVTVNRFFWYWFK
jgi:broad-specificity NMP kinase